ncbi:CAP domain-containing protein [Aquimarina aquimarini]|uniref:CAP domain-containing protein n=1 Tax=Aquimarina aquimarini TaxID=1191734 RepID=UPI000D551D73|nr:CAP domain-containing protein [Aquimarina aquimarini]
MKNLNLFLAIVCIVTFMSCSNDDKEINEVESLEKFTEVHSKNSSQESELLRLVNNFRIENGVQTLRRVSVADNVAAIFPDNTDRCNSPLHTGASQRFTELKRQTGSKSVSENVADGQSNAQRIFQAFVNSSTHRSIMLQSNVNATGISIVQCPDGSLNTVQLFFVQ